jgi:alpha-mannosidase
MQWNDTTKFPHPQFRWRGPDGSEVIAASMFSMEGGFDPVRPIVARRRNEPLVIGYGDGGGGPTRGHLEKARGAGTWERPVAWFERLEKRAPDLPVYDDELYLEYHRGVYTTHHDVKAWNALLERRLEATEERAAWCVAVGVARDGLERVRQALGEAWKIVLRNQFHDVLPGTSISPVYDDAREEYERAGRLVDAAETTLRAMLPRATIAQGEEPPCAPVERDGGFAFANELIEAFVMPSGALVELATRGSKDFVSQANLLATYRDRPKKWDAWNIDAGYDRRRAAGKPQTAEIVDGALLVPFTIGSSGAMMRVSLAPQEPFLRVELAVDWQERRTLLRVENYLATTADEVRYGAPHGTIVRSARTDTPERRAKFEVPGQRFAMVSDGRGGGIAMLSADSYGWSAKVLERGGMQLGHSLLRGTGWPDPDADRGEHQLSWAYAPLSDFRTSAVEKLWQRYAAEPRVRLFTSNDDAVLVVACKPAEEGNAVVVRVRECDGRARSMRLRCGGRMRRVEAVDALERPIEGEARIEGETLLADIGPYALRAFKVTF